MSPRRAACRGRPERGEQAEDGGEESSSGDHGITVLRSGPGRSSGSTRVGFALEDFSALSYLRDCAQQLGIGHDLALIPPFGDPKNLFGLIDSLAQVPHRGVIAPVAGPVLDEATV